MFQTCTNLFHWLGGGERETEMVTQTGKETCKALPHPFHHQAFRPHRKSIWSYRTTFYWAVSKTDSLEWELSYRLFVCSAPSASDNLLCCAIRGLLDPETTCKSKSKNQVTLWVAGEQFAGRMRPSRNRLLNHGAPPNIWCLKRHSENRLQEQPYCIKPGMEKTWKNVTQATPCAWVETSWLPGEEEGCNSRNHPQQPLPAGS